MYTKFNYFFTLLILDFFVSEHSSYINETVGTTAATTGNPPLVEEATEGEGTSLLN